MSEIQLYRKYRFTVDVNGGNHSLILHTRTDLIREMLAATQNGAEVHIKEVWLEDQGVGPTQGDPRSEQQTPQVTRLGRWKRLGSTSVSKGLSSKKHVGQPQRD